MGGGSATQHIITAADVKKDLFKKASDNARHLLKEKTGKDLPDTAELDDIMLPLAEWRFKDEFNIPFERDPLMYKDKNLPGAIMDSIVPIDQLCSIEANSDVDGFIDNVLLSKVNLPKWMADNAKGSLRTLADQLVSQDTNLETRFDSYEIAFDGEKEDDNSWRAKAVIVYLTGSLLEGDIQANITIIYFLAIYYRTNSPTKTVRQTLQKNAYITAQSSFSPSTTITTLADLDKALESYATRTFEEHFGFKYKSTSPPDFDSNASSPLNVGNNHLFYFQDLKVGDLKETVRTVFFQGLNIPDNYPTIKVNALNDVVDHLKEILADIKSGSWSNTFISKTYSPKDPTLNPVEMNVVVVKFYDHASTTNNDAVSCTYIFCQAQLWEVLSPERILTQDIFKMMMKQLPGTAQSNGTSSLLGLKGDLETYAKQQFGTFFKFQFDSKPPDSLPGGKTISFSELGAFDIYPIPSTDVSEWLSSFLGRANFPSYAMVSRDVQTDVLYYTKKFAPNSMWNSESKDWTYDSPDFYYSPIKVSATFVYGLGDMSEKGVHLYKPFIYILMVARSVKGDGGW